MSEAPRDHFQHRARLRTRVTLQSCFLVALPMAIVSFTAVVMMDRAIRQEIAHRYQQASAELERLFDEEKAAAAGAIEQLRQAEEVRALAERVDQEDVLVSDEAEALAPSRAAALHLDLLTIVAARGPWEGRIVSSAHLPRSVEKPAPPFVLRAPRNRVVVGLVHDRVEGNPPPVLPAISAVGTVPSSGKPALQLAVGARLDGPRLANIARVGGVTLVLESPGLKERVFSSRAGWTRPSTTSGPAILLEALDGGRDLSEVGAKPADTPTRIDIFVDTERLESVRDTFIQLALFTTAAAFLFAVLLAAGLSRRITRPILDLASAAREVGEGNLDISLEPRSDDEVGGLVRVFNQMTTELRDSRLRLQRAERVAAWREIARRVAHEIKNPLFPIQMSMETLRKSYQKKHAKLDEIVEESTRTVLDEVRALNRIVTEFSELARLPAPQRSRTNVLDLLDHAYSLYAAEDSKVRLDRARIEAVALPEIDVDRDQLGRVLINLIKNALEAIEQRGSHVVLDAQSMARGDKNGVEISVRDDGPGMPPEIRERVFTPYFTTKSEGTGLGLAIVERIVSEHDGSIDLETEVGMGTAVKVWLPAAPST